MAEDTMPAESQNKPMIAMRYVMAVLGSIGLAIIYGFKVNLSIAFISMVNHTALEPNRTEKLEDGPFLWGKTIEGTIHSMYFVGYLISLIPSGVLAEKVSARWVMNIAVLLNAIASILSPVAAYTGYGLFACMRLIQGLGGGSSFPAMHVMIAKWAPPNERNVIGSIIYAGTALGTVIAILLTGLIAANMSWEAVFYIEGGLCFIWSAAWWLLIEDSPVEQKRFITTYEKNYILKSLGNSDSGHHHNNKQKLPLLKIFTSKPFFAILVAHFCSNCGWYMLLTQLPNYMGDILHFKLTANAGLSSMPYFFMWLFTLVLSNVLTALQTKEIISRTMSRKIATVFASVVPMICFIAVCFVDNATGAVVLMTIGITCIGGMYCGFLANHIDIAPNFAGTLVAITNAIATIPGITVPIVVGYLTDTKDQEQKIFAWQLIFFATAVFYLIEVLAYWIFGTAIEQPWNNSNSYEEFNIGQVVPLSSDEKNDKTP